VPVELMRALAVLAEPPEAGHAAVAEALGLGDVPAASEYSDVFLFHLYPYASVYLGPEGMMGGEAGERVSGFWTALGRTPPAEPDHLSALLGLYATLAGEETAGDGPETRLLAEGRRALLHEQLAPWVFAYLERVAELAGGFYARWARTLAATLERELRVAPTPELLPLHLREAEALPDPRRDGGAAFLAGLLAPVRTGVILTRADLARIALDLDLGIRAGERRYALESMLSQEPVPVLHALATEAARQADHHEGRAPWLGTISDFFARRADATAGLLRDLATEGAERLATAEVGS